jgi:hypothetical protein
MHFVSRASYTYVHTLVSDSQIAEGRLRAQRDEGNVLLASPSNHIQTNRLIDSLVLGHPPFYQRQSNLDLEG